MRRTYQLLVLPLLVLTFSAISVIASPAQQLTIMASFNGTNGNAPSAPLLQASDGNFYGTTLNGGPHNAGTVFQLTPTGTLTTLYSFCPQANCPDGESPIGGLAQGTDGNLYGTTEGGGAHNYGTIFQVSLMGELTTLYSFCSQASCIDGETPSAGLIQASDGNFYGTTYFGGGHNDGTIFKVTPTGTLTTLYSFCSHSGCADGAHPYLGPLVQGTDGNFYGTTFQGGAHNNGAVFKITPAGTLSTLYSFCSLTNCPDGVNPAAGLVQGSDGNFYGTTLYAGTGSGGTVFKVTPTGTLTTLYSFCSQSNCSDGKISYGGLVRGADGGFYGTAWEGGTHSGGTVFKMTPTGTFTTLYSFCSQTNCADGQYPYAGVVQGTDGNLYGTTQNGGTNNLGTVFKFALPTQGVMTSPAPGSQFTGTTVTFTWAPGTQASAYWLDLGSVQGGSNLYQSGNLGNVQTVTVNGLPSDGSTVYATLWSLVNGQWVYNAYTYTAFGGASQKGVITSPAPGSMLAGSSATFTWTAGNGATAYWIDAGSTAGGNQYFQSGNLGNVLSYTVSGLPINGSPVYITLFTYVGGQWLYNEYTYTAYNIGNELAVMQSPTPGTTLHGNMQTFTWSAGPGATAYSLDVGSSSGGNNYYQSGNLGNVLTTTVYSLPADGSQIYVTLWSEVGGQWYYNEYTYTSAP